jgi:hypothetical protein
MEICWNMTGIDPLIATLMPLLFIILIFLTYLNVMESRRGRVIEDKLSKVAESLDKLADKLTENYGN